MTEVTLTGVIGAVAAGDYDRTTTLVNRIVGQLSINSAKYWPLTEAVKRGDVRIVSFLAEHRDKFKLNCSDHDLYLGRALFYAIELRRLSKLDDDQLIVLINTACDHAPITPSLKCGGVSLVTFAVDCRCSPAVIESLLVRGFGADLKVDNSGGRYAVLVLKEIDGLLAKHQPQFIIGDTAVHLAVRNGDTPIVKLLITHGASLDSVNSKGQLLLDSAIKLNENRTEMLTALFGAEKPPDTALNLISYTDDTPLEKLALSARDDGSFEVLANALGSEKARQSLNNNNRANPVLVILFRASRGQVDEVFIAKLIAAGVPVNRVALNGHTILTNAIETQQTVGVIRMLLDNGASVDCGNSVATARNCALFVAQLHPDAVELMSLLMKHTREVDIRLSCGTTPLMHAVSNRRCAIVRVLVDLKASVNNANYYGHTPLHLAVSPHPEAFQLCKFLLQKGADINSETIRGEKPIHQLFAIDAIKQSSIADMASNAIALVRFLIDNGASINSQTDNGKSLLQLSIYNRYHQKIVEELLSLGADPWIRKQSHSPLLLIIVSTQQNYEQVLLRLLLSSSPAQLDRLAADVSRYEWGISSTGVAVERFESVQRKFVLLLHFVENRAQAFGHLKNAQRRIEQRFKINLGEDWDDRMRRCVETVRSMGETAVVCIRSHLGADETGNIRPEAQKLRNILPARLATAVIGSELTVDAVLQHYM